MEASDGKGARYRRCIQCSPRSCIFLRARRPATRAHVPRFCSTLSEPKRSIWKRRRFRKSTPVTKNSPTMTTQTNWHRGGRCDGDSPCVLTGNYPRYASRNSRVCGRPSSCSLTASVERLRTGTSSKRGERDVRSYSRSGKRAVLVMQYVEGSQ